MWAGHGSLFPEAVDIKMPSSLFQGLHSAHMLGVDPEFQDTHDGRTSCPRQLPMREDAASFLTD